MADRGVKLFLALATSYFIIKDVGTVFILHSRWKNEPKGQIFQKFSEVFGKKED